METIQMKTGRAKRKQRTERTSREKKKQDDRLKLNNTINSIKCKWTKMLIIRQTISDIRNTQLHAFYKYTLKTIHRNLKVK